MILAVWELAIFSLRCWPPSGSPHIKRTNATSTLIKGGEKFSGATFVADGAEIQLNDIQSSPAGVRAQALNRKGMLIDDFKIENTMIEILGICSTCSNEGVA